MIDNFSVCLTIPAGRQRYMELLIPQLLREKGWDELQIWVNTADPADLAYINHLPSLDRRIRLLTLPDGVEPDKFHTIHHFFKHCIDPDTVYIRMDDDVVYLEPGSITKLARFRIQNQRPFLVFPVIVNNAVITHILQVLGRIRISRYVPPQCMDPIGWRNPELAEALHRIFLQSLEKGVLSRFKFRSRPIALSRMSINCISWLGKEFARFGGVLGSTDEEEWLSVIRPTELGVANAIFGEVVMAHFAFYPQREHLHTTDILERYRAVLKERATLDV